MNTGSKPKPPVPAGSSAMAPQTRAVKTLMRPA